MLCLGAHSCISIFFFAPKVSFGTFFFSRRWKRCDTIYVPDNYNKAGSLLAVIYKLEEKRKKQLPGKNIEG
jgi:hypothetical protein